MTEARDDRPDGRRRVPVSFVDGGLGRIRKVAEPGEGEGCFEPSGT